MALFNIKNNCRNFESNILLAVRVHVFSARHVKLVSAIVNLHNRDNVSVSIIKYTSRSYIIIVSAQIMPTVDEIV